MKKAYIPLIGALLVLVGFFLPWFSMGLLGALSPELSDGFSPTAASIANLGRSDMFAGESSEGRLLLLLYFFLIIPIAALLLGYWAIRDSTKEKNAALGHIILGGLGLALLIIPTVYVYVAEPEVFAGIDSALSAGIGLWLTLLGLVVMVVGGVMLYQEARAGAYDYGGGSTGGVYEMPSTVPNALAGGGTISAAAAGGQFSGGDPLADVRLSTGGQTYSPSFGSAADVGVPPSRRTEVIEKVDPVDMAWLVIKEGPRTGHSFRLSETTTIGRDTGNDIIIDDTSMSGQHAKVRFENGKQFTLTDLASTNGSFVFDRQKNDWEKIYRLELTDGMQVKLGRTVLHFMTLAGQEAGNPPAAVTN